ncbi:MoaD/ThiS family protein [Candidatus Bathyarchaeota archaeon]|nr:MoaD/ThiS family protein [Candidatus Bathyarchaeota archaeon]
MLEIPKDKATIRDLLREIAAKYDGRILNVISKPNISILLNGQYIEFLKGVNANLSDGDRVAVISIAAGG